MNNQNVAQVLIKKKPEFDVRLSNISNHAESDMYLNLTHKLSKKKPESELRLLVQKHSSGIEYRSESNTPNRQKKARELRSGFLDIQHLRSEYMQANLTQQLSKKNPSTGARDKKLLQTEGSARILQNLK